MEDLGDGARSEFASSSSSSSTSGPSTSGMVAQFAPPSHVSRDATVNAASSNGFGLGLPEDGATIDDTDSDREEIEIDSYSASQELDSSFGVSVAGPGSGSSSSNPNPSPHAINSALWLDSLIKECVGDSPEKDDVSMEGMYSTATERWKGEWFSPSDPTIRSSFRYQSTTWVTDKLPCKICNKVDEVEAFYCDMCDDAYHHHCIGWPTGKKEPKRWFCSEFGRNCQKVTRFRISKKKL